MWVTTKRGFFSVVQHRDAEHLLLIRSRARVDLENLLADLREDGRLVVDLEISEDPKADYRFRLVLARALWTRWLTAQVADLDYDSHCKEEMTKAPLNEVGRYGWYLDCWTAGHRFQERGRERTNPRLGFLDDDWAAAMPVGDAPFWDERDPAAEVTLPPWRGPDVVTLSLDMPMADWDRIATAIGGVLFIDHVDNTRIELDGYEGGTLIFRDGDVLDMLELREDLLIYLIDQNTGES
jgi:hypothetical protein